MESFWIVIAAELIKSANEYSNAILGASDYANVHSNANLGASDYANVNANANSGASDYANALAIVAMAQMAEQRLLIWRTRV